MQTPFVVADDVEIVDDDEVTHYQLPMAVVMAMLDQIGHGVVVVVVDNQKRMQQQLLLLRMDPLWKRVQQELWLDNDDDVHNQQHLQHHFAIRIDHFRNSQLKEGRSYCCFCHYCCCFEMKRGW